MPLWSCTSHVVFMVLTIPFMWPIVNTVYLIHEGSFSLTYHHRPHEQHRLLNSGCRGCPSSLMV